MRGMRNRWEHVLYDFRYYSIPYVGKVAPAEAALFAPRARFWMALRSVLGVARFDSNKKTKYCRVPACVVKKCGTALSKATCSNVNLKHNL